MVRVRNLGLVVVGPFSVSLLVDVKLVQSMANLYATEINFYAFLSHTITFDSIDY